MPSPWLIREIRRELSAEQREEHERKWREIDAALDKLHADAAAYRKARRENEK